MSGCVSFRTMLHAVGRGVRTHEAGHSPNCHIVSCKSDIHVLNGIGLCCPIKVFELTREHLYLLDFERILTTNKITTRSKAKPTHGR